MRSIATSGVPRRETRKPDSPWALHALFQQGAGRDHREGRDKNVRLNERAETLKMCIDESAEENYLDEDEILCPEAVELLLKMAEQCGGRETSNRGCWKCKVDDHQVFSPCPMLVKDILQAIAKQKEAEPIHTLGDEPELLLQASDSEEEPLGEAPQSSDEELEDCGDGGQDWVPQVDDARRKRKEVASSDPGEEEADKDVDEVHGTRDQGERLVYAFISEMKPLIEGQASKPRNDVGTPLRNIQAEVDTGAQSS